MSSELFDAVQAGDLDNMRTLLQSGAEINASDDEGTTVLMLAAGNGHLELVAALIEAGAEINAVDSRGWTALMRAIYNYDLNRGFPEVVRHLIEAGAEFETEIAYGTRPLMLAAGYGEAGVVDVLLAAGADVFAKNEGGRTARLMAEGKDYVEVVNQLYAAEMEQGGMQGSCATKDSSGPSVVNFVRKTEH